jgi:hypothetical protein
MRLHALCNHHKLMAIRSHLQQPLLTYGDGIGMMPRPASQLFVRRCCIAPEMERQLPHLAFTASVCVCYKTLHGKRLCLCCPTMSPHLSQIAAF